MHHVVAVVAQVRDEAAIVPRWRGDKRSIAGLLGQPIVVGVAPAKRMPARIRQPNMPARCIIADGIARLYSECA